MAVIRLGAWLYRVLAVFERPRARAAAIALGFVLLWPALTTGLALDDFILVDQLEARASGEGRGAGPWDLFVFVDGNPRQNHELMDAGAGLPWWTYDKAKGSFFRPLASLTHAFDVRVLGASPPLMHLHSALWLAAAAGAAALAYARLSSSAWVAGVATAMFALDQHPAQTAGWIANRGALIATVFGLLAVWAHDRWRRDPDVRFLPVAMALFAVGLLAGEFGVGALGYLGAHAAFLDPRRDLKRFLAIGPYLALVVVWRGAYVALGYGTSGLGSYLDPLGHTAAFLAAFPGRLALLLSSALGGPPSDFASMVPDSLRSLLLAQAGLGLLVFGWLVLRTLVRSTEARFWATGAVLSAIPVCATLPSDRLLVLVAVGAVGLAAWLLFDVLGRARSAVQGSDGAGAPGRARTALTAVVAATHFVAAPIERPIRAQSITVLSDSVERANATVPHTPAVADKTVVITTVPLSIFASYVPVIRSVRGEPKPEHLYWLAATTSDVALTRPSESVLRVSPEDGFLSSPLERHYRDRSHPMPPGYRVELSEMTAVVVETTEDGRPRVVDFEFARPLSSPDYVWLRWKTDRLVPFELPPVGGSVTFPADRPLEAMFRSSELDSGRGAYLARPTANKNSGVSAVNGTKGVPRKLERIKKSQ